MLRELFSIGDNAVSKCVAVLGSARPAFGPAAFLRILAGSSGLGFTRCRSAKAADQLSDVDFVSTMRAFHPANLATNRL